MQVAGGSGKSVAPTVRAGQRGLKHHGILQGVQRADAEGRKETPDPGESSHLRGTVPSPVEMKTQPLPLPQAGPRKSVRVERLRAVTMGRQGDQAQVREIAEKKMKDSIGDTIESP